MADFVKVAASSDIPKGTGKVVEVAGKTLAVFHCDDGFYAVDNTCRHRGGPVGEGALSGTTVSCPWHGWEYDVVSGACRMDPSMSLQKFPVKVEGNDILVSV